MDDGRRFVDALVDLPFALPTAVAGIVLSLAPGVPVSVFVTTISFVIYLVCWAVSRRHHDPAAA